MKQKIESYLGLDCFFEHTSYNCPKLNLFGFSTDKKLHSAIRQKINKRKEKSSIIYGGSHVAGSLDDNLGDD